MTCPCQLTLGSISGCLGQNNLKIINLFYKRSQEHQTNFQIMLKYYISLGSKRDLGWFGEFPHIENSILVLAVNCCTCKHYANYVSKLCSFVDMLFSKSKKCVVQKLLDIYFLRFKWKIANIFARLWKLAQFCHWAIFPCSAANRDFKIGHYGRLERLDRCHVTQKTRDLLPSSFWNGMFSPGFSSWRQRWNR